MSTKTAITAEEAPAAIGPYSAAIRVDDTLYCSGQTPIDPDTGELVPGCPGCQTHQALVNLSAVLEAAGLTLADVVKTTVFLTDMADFAKMNEMYAEMFSAPFPARSTVAVKELPRNSRVEIEAIAKFG